MITNKFNINPAGYVATDIKSGDRLLISGGTSHEKFLVPDYENIENIYIEADNSFAKFQTNEKIPHGINRNLFNRVRAIFSVIAKNFNTFTKNSSDRNMLYNENGELGLSAMIKSGVCACSELAALAQGYLQKHNIKSAFFNGSIINDNDIDNPDKIKEPEAHSFIVISDNGDFFIFDPTKIILDNENKKIIVPIFSTPKNAADYFFNNNASKRMFLKAYNLQKPDITFAYSNMAHGTQIEETYAYDCDKLCAKQGVFKTSKQSIKRKESLNVIKIQSEHN